MSKGTINKVILIGRLGKDPEMRYLASGAAVANLSVATNYSRKDPQSGEWTEQTEWHRVVLFDKTAEIAGQYLRKGSQVYIEGRLQTRKWQDQGGQDRYSTEVIASEMQMLGGRGEEGGGSYTTAGDSAAPAYAPPTQASRPAPRPASPPPATSSMPPPGNFDEDIPF